jgi:hypothetical protein
MRRLTALGLGLAIAGCMGLPMHVNAENKPDPFDDPFFKPDPDRAENTPATNDDCTRFYYDSRCSVPSALPDKKAVNPAPNAVKKRPISTPGANAKQPPNRVN